MRPTGVVQGCQRRGERLEINERFRQCQWLAGRGREHIAQGGGIEITFDPEGARGKLKISEIWADTGMGEMRQFAPAVFKLAAGFIIWHIR